MKKTVLFLEQQSWLGGAQRVLEATLSSLPMQFRPIVAFPDKGLFRESLDCKGIDTLTAAIGTYRSGGKSCLEMAVFAFRSVLSGFKLAAVIRRKQVALVYINGPRCLPAGMLAAWLTGRPSVFHLHLILTRKAEVFLVTCLARRVSRIVACSRAAADALSHADPRLFEKTRVIHNPVPVRTTQPGAAGRMPALPGEPGHFTIGMVGRITPAKGHHVLLNAVGRLRPEIKSSIRIVIVGAAAPGCEADLHYAYALDACAIRYNLQEKIVWTGYQSDPGPYYGSMDVLVHPALAEAMCLAVLEALARGIPVIAARTGGIPEIVRDGSNGLLVAPGDEEALGRALALFIQNRPLRERLRAGASSGLDDRFSLRTFAPEIRALIGELCSSTGSNEASWK